ncbi:pentapeptide repeat-containing protein [Thiothrix nivea]|uniref:Pentapeptide repeat protein n=1 Tax=Thiothrix nivea (strain ATCC 35100 / DSM 5205 / JP2) TaxID=870187 RepID=A0A656H9I5_THINJ|nr:pentapeptide repeat-containing protein [Thiothrix nivea]EIJ32743.1 hypothetical protein Thini_0074 [Thiothrix nivea DSM 5205]
MYSLLAVSGGAGPDQFDNRRAPRSGYQPVRVDAFAPASDSPRESLRSHKRATQLRRVMHKTDKVIPDRDTMTVNDRNRYAFSYQTHDVRDKSFIFKNFNKSCSYQSNFSNSTFKSTSFIGTKFKFCSFYGSIFEDCLIRGALFRKCNLDNAKFINSIISATNFENPKIKGLKFINCTIISSQRIDYLSKKCDFDNSKILNSYPNINDFSPELIQITESLRDNQFIRKSTTLHRKRGLLDTVSLNILVSEFGEEFLIKKLPRLPQSINNEFHTLSYIQKILQKLRHDDNF